MQRWVRELAPHDWLVLGFVVILNLASYSVADATRGGQCLQVATAMLAVLLVVLGLVRSGWLRDSWLAPLLYRVAIYGSVQLSYFFLGWLLPMLNRGTLDTELYALDLALFGFEPALAMDGWVTPLSTEWFAFFYYSYFLILALHVVPILFGSRSQRLLGEFALGMLLVFCLLGPGRRVSEAAAQRAVGGFGDGNRRVRRLSAGHIPVAAHRCPRLHHAVRFPPPQPDPVPLHLAADGILFSQHHRGDDVPTVALRD
jgi:hypothetical protein